MSEKQSSKSITIKTKILSWVEQNIILITFASACITIIFLFVGYAINGRLSGGDFDHDYLGALGDFLGGFLGSIFGIVTIYLVYKTYISQKEELRLSRELIQKQNEEIKSNNENQKKERDYNRFLRLIDAYKQSINQIIIATDPINKPRHLVGIYAINQHLFEIENKISIITSNESLMSKDDLLKTEITNWYTERKILYQSFTKSFGIILKHINTIDNTADKNLYYSILSNTLSTSEQYLLFYFSEVLNSSDENHIYLKKEIPKLDFYGYINARRRALSDYTKFIFIADTDSINLS